MILRFVLRLLLMPNAFALEEKASPPLSMRSMECTKSANLGSPHTPQGVALRHDFVKLICLLAKMMTSEIKCFDDPWSCIVFLKSLDVHRMLPGSPGGDV